MTLFQHREKLYLRRNAPLAARMRPRTFDEFVGQDHIVGHGKVLRKSIESDHLPSMVLWGPPGTGKTTLANLISELTNSHFSSVSAVESGVAELRRIVSGAKERLGMHGKNTILFVDEIHRFNKGQQDVILPHVERGTVVFIGATTENPSFEVVSPLLSRSRVFALRSLSDKHIEELVFRAIQDRERGLFNLGLKLDGNVMKVLVTLANGDARSALNALELAAFATEPDRDGLRNVLQVTVEDAMQQRAIVFDKAGDQHYDTISAFIKSVRGSDPDAAIYWLARMLEAGEDPLFIARRLVILAAEDIGLADPTALSLAVATQQAIHFVGMPEGRIPLGEATLYLAAAPKSNSVYSAINSALEEVRKNRNEPVPLHLRNAVTGLGRNMGYGEDYKYSHNYKDHFAPMQNLPDNLKGRHYYVPSDQGDEKEAKDRLQALWGREETG